MSTTSDVFAAHERQERQKQRHLEWRREGHLEWPVQLDTYLKPHQQERIAWLKAHAQGRILEVGCSWGYVLAAVGGHVGVDLNSENVQVARVLARGRTFRTMDARELRFPSRRFDTVILADILEHLAFVDVPRALGEAVRVCKGQVLITLPVGDADTEDATSGKHQWLATSEVVQTLFGHCAVEQANGFWRIIWECGHGEG